MPEKESEVFSNPLPPQHEIAYASAADNSQPLTNDDFRKLMMTPRVTSSTRPVTAEPVAPKETPKSTEEDAATRRKKKKMYYAQLKQQEDKRDKELQEKYRDRARERRDGFNKDYDETEFVSTTADYRAVAPDAKARGDTYKEHRKQVIQESKYLGGDMEHTHLVKGLDFALLEKVRAEITTKEEQLEEEGMEEALEAKKEDKEDPEPKMEFKTRMGRNIYRSAFRNRVTERNELFLPKRMAYIVELEDDDVDTDVPTTLIRSKADCPTVEQTTTLSTNDIVINKLTQILSYLRQGRRDRKKKLKEKMKAKEEEKSKLVAADDVGIYGEIGDYLPSFSKSKKDEKEREKKERREKDRHEKERETSRREREKERHGRYGDRDRQRERRDRDARHDRDGEKKRSYFEKPADEDEDMRGRDRQSARDLVQSINDKFGGRDSGWAENYNEEEKRQDEGKRKEEERVAKLKKKAEIDSYAECYPGFAEADDAIVESDDEADYTKMDPGNKKGPLSRWDFDTQDDYSNYMSNKEALPKAAFQYGVKMADGRKTRRAGPKDEKKELDREWQKIQNIMQKRKQMGTEGPGNKYAKY